MRTPSHLGDLVSSGAATGDKGVPPPPPVVSSSSSMRDAMKGDADSLKRAVTRAGM
jgi:hypothetical protein